jgi:hypothetical protein
MKFFLAWMFLLLLLALAIAIGSNTQSPNVSQRIDLAIGVQSETTCLL